MREMVIADRFGTSEIYDLYLIGLMLPALMYGVINFAGVYFFVPYITRRLNHTDSTQSGWQAIWPVINSTHLVSILLTAVLILCAPYIMKIWASEYSAEQFTQIIFYSRLTALVIVLGTVEAFLRSFLNVKKIFTYPAGGYIVFNLISISIIVILAGTLSVSAIAYGLVLGVAGQTVYLMIKVSRYKPFEKYRFTFFDESTTVFFTGAGIVLLVELINRSYFLFDRYFAPQFGEGIIAGLNYAQVLIQLPDSIMGFAIGSVVFPLLSESKERLDLARFQAIYSRALITALLIGIPVAIGYFVLAPELVTLLFKRGAFDQQSVDITVTVLRPFIVSILALFVISTSIRAGYALHANKLILLFAVVVLFVKWQGNIWLSQFFGYAGLSGATALSHAGFALLLMIMIVRNFNSADKKQLFNVIVKLLLIGVIIGYTLIHLKPYLVFSLHMNAYPDILLRILLVGSTLLIFYFIGIYGFGLYPGFRELLSKLRNKTDE